MKRYNLTFIIATSIILSACSGTDGLNSLTISSIETAGVNCSSGGLQLQTGLDEDANNLLEPSEVDSIEYVCNGDNGLQSLINITTGEATFECASGGHSIDYGIDDNNNSILDTAEIDGNATFCLDMCLNPPFAINYDFTDMGTLTTASLDLTGVSITGAPGNLHVLNFNGLGVVGGITETYIDNGESITYTFTRPALMVSYFVNAAHNGDGDNQLGEAYIEAFDIDGSSLGTFDTYGLGTKNVSQMFGDVPISSFTVTAYNEGHRQYRLNFTTCN